MHMCAFISTYNQTIQTDYHICLYMFTVCTIYIYVYIMYENENFVMQCKRNTIDDNNVKQRTLIRNQLMHLSTKKPKTDRDQIVVTTTFPS